MLIGKLQGLSHSSKVYLETDDLGVITKGSESI